MLDPTYRYCPRCATPLELREIYNLARPVCPACDFVYFRDPKVAVVGLVTHQKHVLLVQRAINPEKGKWALPGGYMDAGEMPQDALRRELKEEVNLAVRVTDLLTIFPMITNRTNETASPGIVLAFRAEVAERATPKLTCDDDVSDAGWFGPQELPTDLAFASTEQLLAEWVDQQL
ncbi:MAG TPA: NUDIX hydrolase [Caldilineaceae bacterium]|nr:NUDIX hydrolase [Caldilineaceae bacterium]